MSITDPGSGHPSDAHNTDAVRFALHRLTQAQGAGIIQPGAGGAALQWSQDPQTLMNQYHHYSPLIAQQIHRGASLQQPSVHPLPAPQAQAHHPYAPGGGGAGYAPQQATTLPQHVAGTPGAPVPAPVDPNLLILNKLLGLPQ